MLLFFQISIFFCPVLRKYVSLQSGRFEKKSSGSDLCEFVFYGTKSFTLAANL